jgi:hypothetical protein
VGRAVLDAICEEAAAAAGLDDFGDDWFLGPLAAWAQDLAQPNLNDFGRRFLRSLAVKDTARRLRVLDVLRRHPEILEIPIPPVIHITGQWRSGTTFLHNLLARHRSARALLRWELIHPVPPPEAESYASDPRIAAVQATVDKLRGSVLERMHWVNADEPEECAWGFIDAVSMLGQAPALWMPQWRSFLMREDPTPAYEHYRSVIQLLLWKHPLAPHGRLVLKSPQIALHLCAFAAVFPEARFVVLDRDPFRCAVSAAAMVHSIANPFFQENPLTDDGSRGRHVLAWMSQTLAAISEFSTAQPNRVAHIHYPDLLADPTATVQAVFAAIGLPLDDALDAEIAAFLSSQRSGGRAAPPEELPAMGYTEDIVRSEPNVQAYCHRFDVWSEAARLTGVHGSR